MKKPMLLIMTLFLVVFLLGAVDAANTITVGSSDCNFTTIQEAINNASDGDTIKVTAGEYKITETIDLTRPVTIRGVSSETTIINGTSSDLSYLFDIQSSDVTIQNLKITVDSIGDLDSVIIVSGKDKYSNVTIKDNEIYVPVQSGAMKGWSAKAIVVGTRITKDDGVLI